MYTAHQSHQCKGAAAFRNLLDQRHTRTAGNEVEVNGVDPRKTKLGGFGVEVIGNIYFSHVYYRQ